MFDFRFWILDFCRRSFVFSATAPKRRYVVFDGFADVASHVEVVELEYKEWAGMSF